MKLLATTLLAVCAQACALDGEITPDAMRAIDARADTVVSTDAGLSDAGALDAPAPDASTFGDAISDVAPQGTAPPGALAGEVALVAGANNVSLSAGQEFIGRIEASPNEHIAFVLSFTPTTTPVVMGVQRWNGVSAETLGQTDARAGQRFLAVFDPAGPRTFWVRIRSATGTTTGSLVVTRTPFHDASTCDGDCEHLLQLPLPNAPLRDGYAVASNTVFRYQFGRRDMLMYLRHAGQSMMSQQRTPFIPEDLSQWDGATPGTDVSAPRHASHQRGKDVDISLYGSDLLSAWRSYCTTQSVTDGRACVAGTMRNFDGSANAHMFADWFATTCVTMMFLDQELISYVRTGARAAVTANTIPSGLLSNFTDGVHLQHWPNHDNHVHIRVSEVAYGTMAIVVEDPHAPVEAP